MDRRVFCEIRVLPFRDRLDQVDIPEDHDGHINFVKVTLESKLVHYERFIDEYKLDRYPQKN